MKFELKAPLEEYFGLKTNGKETETHHIGISVYIREIKIGFWVNLTAPCKKITADSWEFDQLGKKYLGFTTCGFHLITLGCTFPFYVFIFVFAWILWKFGFFKMNSGNIRKRKCLQV